jgi:acetolactate synthase-like protein
LGGMARGLLGRSSPINMRQARKEALREADVVILGGGVADFRLGYGRVFSSKSKVIAVNRSKEQLYKNAKVFWNPSLAIQADSAQFFVELANGLSGFKVDEEWVSTLRAREDEKEKNAKQMALNVPEEHLNPLKVLSLLFII